MKFEVIILAMSGIACMVHEFSDVLMSRGPRGHGEQSGYIEPMDYTDALFMASRDHRYADFAESWEFLANVQVFFPRDV